MGLDQVLVESTLRLVEAGCCEVHTHCGEKVSLTTLRTLVAKHGRIPADLVLVVTDKGRDALARGRP